MGPAGVRVQGDQSAEAGDEAQCERLTVHFRTPEELLDAFERELIHGAVFVPDSGTLPTGTCVGIVLDLAFCGARIELEGEVVATRPAPLAELAPGVSLQLLGSPDDLRRRLVETTRLFLPEPDPTPAGKTIRAPRFDAVTVVQIEAEGRHFTGKTANLSYNGMLALVPGADLANGVSLQLRIEPAGDGAALELGGQLANQMPCDSGERALGVQFRYDLDRFDEVSSFVDGLRSLHHARSLVTVEGTLRDVPLETVLDTAAGASSEGTVLLRRGSEEGRIAYRDGAIVAAVTGLETGERALARMFCWTEAQFEVQPEVLPIGLPTDPLPLTSAMLLASVERDELARLDLGRLGPDTLFTVDEERFAGLEASLDELSRELVANAALGFPIATLLDMAAGSDVLVYKAITELIDAGVLRLDAS